MKKIYFLAIGIMVSQVIEAQSIRKNYLEMTPLERINLVNAFYQLRLGPDLINDLSVFHGAFFNFDGLPNAMQPDIHFNLPDEPEREVFFAWHRQQIFEVEQAMKDINPYITMPYWNTSTDQSITSSIWDFDFMGQFNIDWRLNRNLGGNDMLPFPSEVTQVQSEINFLLYSDLMERGSVHHGPHRWIGGAMAATVSPRDPVFYLHHAYIDKLWKDWQDGGNSSSYLRQNMLRYDGTYVFNGHSLPSVNPNDIINSRTYGTFYADNQIALLDNYSVNNIYRTEELFFYQYTIKVGANFEVPSGKKAKIESKTKIWLAAGFHASEGSNFLATIGEGPSLRDFPFIVRNQIPFNNNMTIDWDAYDPDKSYHNDGVDQIHLFPNPFINKLTLVSQTVYENWIVKICDLTGRVLSKQNYSGTSCVEINNLDYLKQGIYLLSISVNGTVINTSVVIKR